jgi:hypothetical protein
MNDHEIAFAHSFIVPEKRRRYIELLSNPKRRFKLLARLNHSSDIDFSLADPTNDIAAASVATILRNEGAGSMCHVIADASDYDGSDRALSQALEIAYLHPFGIILSCIPGKLAFYKPESPGLKYILRQKQEKQ